MSTDLTVTLRSHPEGVAVRWRLDGGALDWGEPVGQLPTMIAGVPTTVLEALVVTDDHGPVPSEVSVEDGPGDEALRVWRVQRPTAGSVEVSYVAPALVSEPRAATPPLELRREGAGLSGAAKSFLVFPPERGHLTFELRCEQPAGEEAGKGWMWVTSLGEAAVDRGGAFEGVGLELLGDTYVMWGPLADQHVRDGAVSTWWLTQPPFDAAAFTTRLGATYQMMSEAFDAPAHPYRVFLRTSPYRGHSGSAHPASFVMTENPDEPVDERLLYDTVAHELVHEWLRLDGPAEEVTWFVEGAADYYSLVLPLRAGLLDEGDFLREVNFASRLGYANPLRHLSLDEASALYWSDFRAHRLPYVRGMFYLADLDVRLKHSTNGHDSVDDLVRDVRRSRHAGKHVGVDEWCARTTSLLGDDESSVLDRFVFSGDLRPGPGAFGPRFEVASVEVPVLDLGMDATTFVTRRVAGVVPDGPADRAGLKDGDVVELPGYARATALNVGDCLSVRVLSDDETRLVSIPLDSPTALVPQWRPSHP